MAPGCMRIESQRLCSLMRIILGGRHHSRDIQIHGILKGASAWRLNHEENEREGGQGTKCIIMLSYD